jgi:hypothetical protein
MRSPGNRPRFAADEMLGSLAKWLRIMGYDTSYERDMKDDDILEGARMQGRFLLTRDKLLARKASPDGLYIASDVIGEQVGQVARHFRLDFDEKGTRCAVCNGALALITKEEASYSVPPRSLSMTDEFFRCSVCGQIFWKGTHWNNILKKLSEFGVDQGMSRE